jgi:hypothetical protein
MRRLSAILLIATFLALGSGTLERLHNLDHAAEDAIRMALTGGNGVPQHMPPVHDETNCDIHAQLHLPMISIGWVPLLVFTGVFVAFLSEIARPLVSQPSFFRIDCRGPPAC